MYLLENIEYDYKDASAIECYSQKLIGRTFREIWEIDNARKSESGDSIFEKIEDDKKNKGNLGELIEEKFFHIKKNNDPRPDFPEAGVELKVTPFKINKNGKLSAKERLMLTTINYGTIINEDFETSHLWNKCSKILLVHYQYDEAKRYNLDYTIRFSKLFTPPPEDKEIIKKDFQIIQEKVRLGRAHELSEGDTLYLGAATKAEKSSDRCNQPFSTELAKPRAFSFKSSYMTYILNTYITSGKSAYESIIKDGLTADFEKYVVDKINAYKGRSAEELVEIFNIDVITHPKNIKAMLTYRMLGIKGNNAEEFVKANIVVKTIRVQRSGRIKESMSFPTFKFDELIKETWEDSTLGNYLRDTRFLFVVFKTDENDVLRLSGCRFWNIPYEDLEKEVKRVWEQTKDTIINISKIKEIHNGEHYISIFPKKTDNRVSHVRPHGRNSKDTYILPDGRAYPKQCFWLNNSYIETIIKDV